MRRFFLAVCLSLSGCGGGTEEHTDGHKHEHKAPHGGALIELSEEFAQVEIVFDARIGAVNAYVLDGCLQKAIPVDQAELKVSVALAPRREPLALTLTAVANPLTGETVGHSSVFSAANPALRGAEKLEGVIESVTVQGREFKQVAFQCPAHKK